MAVTGEFRLPMSGGDVGVNCADQTTLLKNIRHRLVSGQGFALATVNLDHIVKLETLEPFRKAYAEQDFVVADGNPIVWLSRLARKPVSLVTGSDLVEPLLRLAAEEGVTVALVGSTSETLATAARRLEERIPGLTVAACIAPAQGFEPHGEEADLVIEQLRRSGARLTLVALGAPKQELFAARAKAEIPGMGLASIGAGLDFIAGSQARAPIWVRKIAMEWLWRMLSQPRRLAKRYLHCALILPKLALGIIARRPAS